MGGFCLILKVSLFFLFVVLCVSAIVLRARMKGNEVVHAV